MSAFDIEKFLDPDFKPARYRCYRCLSLWTGIPWPENQDEAYQCPQCSVKYYPKNGEGGTGDLGIFLGSKGCSLQMGDLIGHATRLAQAARYFKNRKIPPTWPYDVYSPMAALLQAFALAKRFIHFASFGLTPYMLGVLTATAQRVPVNGVVTSNSTRTSDLLKAAQSSYDEVGERLVLRELTAQDSSIDLPHQKLVVVDGLLAFKGSANLTEFAWRKAKDGLEMVEVVTDVEEVINLNNQYFSPIWLNASKHREPISGFDYSCLDHPEGICVEGILMDSDPMPWEYFDLPLSP